MQPIAHAAKKLQELLAFNDLVKALETAEFFPVTFEDLQEGRIDLQTICEQSSSAAAHKWRFLNEELRKVQLVAAAYASVPKLDLGRKSPERCLIWEPLFDLWVSEGSTLGFAEHGPIVRMLRAIHGGLSLAPPNLNSVKHAVGDFKKKGGVQQN
jgi:hypothetical protein